MNDAVSWPERYEIIKDKILSLLPESAGKSRSAMAEWLKKPLSTVQRWDNGQRPSPKDTAYLTVRLQLNPEWVLLGKGVPETDKQICLPVDMPRWSVQFTVIDGIAQDVFADYGIKYSHLALERAVGFKQGRIHSWLKNNSQPRTDDLEALARYLGLSAEWLLMGEGRPLAKDHLEAELLVVETPKAKPETPPVNSKSAKVLPFASPHKPADTMPVYGLAKCGIHGWECKRPMAIGVERLAGLSDQAFAVLPVGDSMEPEAIREGYVCYCDPSRTPEIGDAVYVQDKAGNATLKLFMGEAPDNEGWHRLRGWLPKKFDEEGQKPFNLDIEAAYVTLMAPVVFVKRRL